MCQAERGRFREYAAAVSATTPAARDPALEALRARVSVCTRCPELVRARTQVVFGSGPADADLVFVGEAPGPAEDREGDPLTGAAGALLDELLAGIGRSRADVAIVTIVRCRPPENRSPQRAEIERCREYLDEQLALLAPVVVCPLGTFATRALRGDRAPVTAVRGAAEVRTLGTRAVRLYPLLHPAAAL
jgi:DNA polymerase